MQLAFLGKDDAPKDKYLDQAQDLIDRGRQRKGASGELFALQDYLYQARLAVSPMLRVKEYGPKVSAMLQDAKQADPQNPHVSYLMVSNLYYKPAMFGGGAATTKPWLVQAVALYISTRPATPLSQRWGQSEAVALLAQVKD